MSFSADLKFDNRSPTLYDLAPFFHRSFLSESLTSYISRLAKAHCVKTGTLFSRVIFPHLNKAYMNEIIIKGGNGFYNSAHSMNGIGSMAEQFVELISTLTDNNGIGSLTLLRFQDVTSNRGLLRNKRAWCSNCFGEMARSGNDHIYEPLYWSIKSVTCCILHNNVLADICPNCSRKALILERRSEPGYCPYCSYWLGNKQEKTDADDAELSKALMVCELLCNAPDTLKHTNVVKTLSELVARHSEGNVAAFAEKMGICKTTFWTWYRGKCLPSLEDVIRICSKLGITMTEFYSASINYQISPVLLAKRVNRGSKDITEIPLYDLQNEAKKFLITKGSEVLSVRKMAKKLRCNKKTLYKYCKALCQIQAKKHKLFVQRSRIKRVRQIRKDIRTAHDYLSNCRSSVTRRNLENVLAKPGVFKEYVIRSYCKMISTGA